ncbi:MAG: membrane lipoprotein lipid attachment site-containing protein [Bacteroidales bacterium]|nr:membrane lipoprotein lipid attachment site-containing protein [Bacteroidales bacterium]
MKKILSFMMVAVLALMLAGCSKYDDSDLQRRVSALEAYQSLLQKLDSGKPVTSYSQSGTDVTFNFGDGSSITIDNKPSAENPIKTITADGSTLTITLADGTVIPVAYGEKEGYGFTVGDGKRHYYSYSESVESFRTGKIILPYTLTGDLKSIDDVTLVANVNVFSGDPIHSQEVVVFEPIDAKSGNVILKRVEEPVVYDWGQWWKDYSPADIDLMAFFPDGTSRVYKLHIVGSEILAEGADDYYFETNDVTEEMEPIVISAGAGSFSFDVYNFIYGKNSDYYDGPELTPFNFKDILYCNSTSGFYANTMFTRYTVSAPQMTENRKEVKYTVTATYQANTTGKERRCYVSVVRYMNENSGTYLFSFPIIQPAL